MATTLFAPFFRPEKVLWVFPKVDSIEEALNCYKSKSTKKFLSKFDQIVDQYNLSVNFQECSKDEYLNWLNSYEKFVQEEHYDIFATAQWYDDRIVENKKIYITSIMHNDSNVAACITVATPETASIAFKWNQKTFDFKEKNGSLGLLADFVTIKHLFEMKIEKISSGNSRNLFGIINKYGYLVFKTVAGYVAEISNKGEFKQDDVEIPENGLYTFLSEKPEKSASIALHFFPGANGSSPDPEILRLYPDMIVHS